jgi:hypothetical protein
MARRGEAISALATPFAAALHAFHLEHEYCGELDRLVSHAIESVDPRAAKGK